MCLLEESQKARKHSVEDESLDEDKCQQVWSPLDVTSIFSNANSVASLPTGADTCHSPQDTCSGFCMQPQLKPSVSQHQKPAPELKVKQAGVQLESPLSCLSHNTSQTAFVSQNIECPPTRKRPFETLTLKPDINNPKLDDPLADKRSQSNIESASSVTRVKMFETEHNKKEPQSNEQDKFDRKCTNIKALLVESMSDIAYKSNLNNTGFDNAYANNSSHTGVKSSYEQVQTLSSMANEMRKFHSKPNLPPKATFLVPWETKLIASETEANGVGVFHSASTSKLGESQPKWNINVQRTFGDLNHFKRSDSEAPKHVPVLKPQPPGPKTQFPISPIITPRPESFYQQSMGGYTRQNHLEVNRDDQSTRRFLTVEAINPSDRGQYGHYDQMAYITNGHLSSGLSAQAPTGYTRQDNPLTYNRSRVLLGGYMQRVYDSSQMHLEQNSNQLGQLANYNTPSSVGPRDGRAATAAPESAPLVKHCPCCEKKYMDE